MRPASCAGRVTGAPPTGYVSHGKLTANTLLFPVVPDERNWLYPDPQYNVPSTIDAPDATEPPVTKLHLICPVVASRANKCPAGSEDPTYTTPLAVIVWPMSPNVGPAGSADCHSTAPVAPS